MVINWPLIGVLFCLSLPGVCIVMQRLITFLLPDNSPDLKKRITRMAIIQTLFMVLILSFAGSVFSLKTGLNAPLLEGMLHGKINWSGLQQILLPTFLYAIFALLVFCGLYYGLAGSVLDDHTMQVLSKLRAALGVDGCVLYGGVVEEVIARWGLMNLIAFFLIFFVEHQSDLIIWTSIIVSGLMLGVGQIPAYIAAGCKANRRFMYVILLISLWPSLVFGYLFWQYGLISCILAHMIFYLGWSRYDPL